MKTSGFSSRNLFCQNCSFDDLELWLYVWCVFIIRKPALQTLNKTYSFAQQDAQVFSLDVKLLCLMLFLCAPMLHSWFVVILRLVSAIIFKHVAARSLITFQKLCFVLDSSYGSKKCSRRAMASPFLGWSKNDNATRPVPQIHWRKYSLGNFEIKKESGCIDFRK